MKFYYLYSFVFIVLFSCAVVKPPQGGPKDETPPNVLYQSPQNGTLNFTSNQIVLSFDEFIELSNWSKEVTVSPYIDPKNIKTLVKGKKLFVTLPSDLASNSTYTIDFGNSIIDLTEKNALKNLSITFSTGPTLDSLFLSGQIMNRNSLPSTQFLLIGLYPLNDSISPTKDKPLYFTKTTSDTFQLNYLPNGDYQLFCFNDLNHNTLYDSLTEKIAFLNKINTQQIDTLQLSLFQEDFRKFQFSRPLYSNNYVETSFTKGLFSLQMNLPHLYNEKDKSLRIYSIPSTNQISLKAEDSTGHLIDTTFLVQASSAKFVDSTFSISRITTYRELQNFAGISIYSPHLIETVLWDSIHIVLNQDTIPFTDSRILVDFTSLNNVIRFRPKNSNDTLSVYFSKHSLISPSAHYNINFSATYIPQDVKKLGNISGSVETEEKNYILYLYNKSNVLISQELNPKTFTFSNLTPDTYHIEVLIDTNNNQVYDSGRLTARKQAETIIIYPKPIVVKPSWDMGNINISF